MTRQQFIEWFVYLAGMEKIENVLAAEAIGFAVAYEFRRSNHKVDVERSLPIIYEEVRLDHGYRMDLLINDKLVIEIKSVDALRDVHFAQVLTYLKVGDYRLGLLLNFKVAHLKDGLKRVVNKL